MKRSGTRSDGGLTLATPVTNQPSARIVFCYYVNNKRCHLIVLLIRFCNTLIYNYSQANKGGVVIVFVAVVEKGRFTVSKKKLLKGNTKIWWDKLVNNGSMKLPRAFAIRQRVIRSLERLSRYLLLPGL